MAHSWKYAAILQTKTSNKIYVNKSHLNGQLVMMNWLAIVKRDGCSKVVSTGQISVYHNSNMTVRLSVLKQKKVQWH